MAQRFELIDEYGKRRVLMYRASDGMMVEIGDDGEPVKVTGPQDLQALTLEVRDRDYQLYQRLKHGEAVYEAATSATTAEGFLDALELLFRRAIGRRRG